ncbi:hypothetical protein BX600DRAFT_548576 [Xylariales sp. PMI_506]|nr:hypothetical protein BX600DRAFT_548576 [Xylariales sp. PMI_506]
MPFPYKYVLIIGATSGIGLALAERMIDNGVFVVAVGRRQDRLDAFVSKHGADKAASSQCDISDLQGLRSWSQSVLATHPQIDAVVLNAGIQRSLDFTKAAAIDLDLVQREITTNYTSYVCLLAHLLPHLQELQQPAAVILVSSGLGVVPIPRCANYCATKAALHSLCWSLREQLNPSSPSATTSPDSSGTGGGGGGGGGVRVIEIIPPAVQTELHTQQADLVAEGIANIGMGLDEFTDEAWAALEEGREDEILIGAIRTRFGGVDEERRKTFRMILGALRAQEQQKNAGSQ